MKHTSMMILLLSLVLWGCSESSTKKKKSSSSTDQLNCATYPWMSGCNGTTTGSTTGGSGLDCNNQNYWQTPGCGGFCMQMPSHSSCNGGGAGGGNYTTIPSDNNWRDLYPGTSSFPEKCTTNPDGISGTGNYAPRRGTITVSGGTWYSPDNAWTAVGESEYRSVAYTHNNSSFLVNTQEAKSFLSTDAKLKLRFHVRPQPKTPAVKYVNGQPVYKSWCYNRTTGQAGSTYGYGGLEFTVALRGVNADGTLKPALLGTKTVKVGTGACSPALDFSSYAKHTDAANGLVVVVSDVYSDQGCWYSGGCTAYTSVKSSNCWSMDIEASVDGTRDF